MTSATAPLCTPGLSAHTAATALRVPRECLQGRCAARQETIVESGEEEGFDVDASWSEATRPPHVRFDSLSTHSETTCGVTPGGIVYCWGAYRMVP